LGFCKVKVRHRFEWKNTLVDDFSATRGVNLIRKKNDKWDWKGSSLKMYTVKEAYRILSEGLLGHREEAFQRL